MFFDIVASSIVFHLGRFPNQGINNSFMVFFNVVLLDMAIILCSLFSPEINSVTLLQNGINFLESPINNPSNNSSNAILNREYEDIMVKFGIGALMGAFGTIPYLFSRKKKKEKHRE